MSDFAGNDNRSPHCEYDVFLSHNSADKEAVTQLAVTLRELGVTPWFDAWHLVPGELWLPAIERALSVSKACIVAVGPRGLGNVHEDELWLALHRGIASKDDKSRFRVIPVLLPQATRGDRSQLPEFLTANTWVEFSHSIDDPAALDRLDKAIRGMAPADGSAPLDRECPYRGLKHFDVEHSHLYFGREVLTDWILSRLRGTASRDGPTRFLSLIGASGSGKSLLARAGLLAKLKEGALPGSEHWPQLICRPGQRPLESLATAVSKLDDTIRGTSARAELIASLTRAFLGSPEQLHFVSQGAMPANDPNWRIVILIDQFEELFTVDASEQPAPQQTAPQTSPLSADRRAFIQNLLRAATIEGGRTIVLITMRADFYGKCALLPELASAVSCHQELVGPLTSEDLRRAIETPAHLVGTAIEPGLVELLTREVSQQPGALPLLQYTLAELWQSSRELGTRNLTTAAYRELGGWEGALSRRADLVLAEFREAGEKSLCRQLLLHLIQPGESTEDTKRLVRWNELSHGSAEDSKRLEKLVNKLVDNRLLITGTDGARSGTFVWDSQSNLGLSEAECVSQIDANTTIELVHEALIRSWPTLRRWLDADRSGLRTHRRLGEAAKEWARSDPELNARDHTLLFSGTRLAVAREWAETNPERLNEVERTFLKASLNAIRDKRLRTLRLAGGILLMTIAAVVMAIWSWSAAKHPIRAETLLEKLRSADTVDVRSILSALEPYRDLITPELRKDFQTAGNSQLNAALALVADDASVVDYLVDRLVDSELENFPAIRYALQQYSQEILPRLWTIAGDFSGQPRTSFRAACALAAYDPANHNWDHDPGIHGSAEWLLHQWDMRDAVLDTVNRLKTADDRNGADFLERSRRWFVNSEGQTFAVLHAGEFPMDSPSSEEGRFENEMLHRRRLDRTYAIATKEVSNLQYRRFLSENPDITDSNRERFGRSEDAPQVGVNWYHAARYCNWLSRCDGVPESQWCYVPNEKGEYSTGMRPAPDFLKRDGYRLPTEAEWEFACRGATTTSRYYGTIASLLPKYAWSTENTIGNFVRPVGRLKPNDFGLFDMLGNAHEWCHDRYAPYPLTESSDVIADLGDESPINESDLRVLRGGSFNDRSSFIRCAFRGSFRPGDVTDLVLSGFRPARTITYLDSR